MRLKRWDGIGFTIESDRTVPKNLEEFVATFGCREVLIQQSAIRFIRRRLKQNRLNGYGHLIITRQCSWSISLPDRLKNKNDFEIAIISLPIAYIASAIGETDIDFSIFDYGAKIKIPWRVLARHSAVISIVAGLLRLALIISCHPDNRKAFREVFKFIDGNDVRDAFTEKDIETLRFIFTHIMRRLKESIDPEFMDFLSDRVYNSQPDKDLHYLKVFDFVYNTAEKGNLFKILKQDDWQHILFRGIVAFMRDNYDYVRKFIPEYKEVEE